MLNEIEEMKKKMLRVKMRRMILDEEMCDVICKFDIIYSFIY